jgi:hypothetical protein
MFEPGIFEPGIFEPGMFAPGEFQPGSFEPGKMCRFLECPLIVCGRRACRGKKRSRWMGQQTKKRLKRPSGDIGLTRRPIDDRTDTCRGNYLFERRLLKPASCGLGLLPN